MRQATPTTNRRAIRRRRGGRAAALLAAVLALSACSSGPQPAPGRQEREAGAEALAGSDGPVNDAYIAGLMGQTGFDLRRCDASIGAQAAVAGNGRTDPSRVAEARSACVDAATRHEDQLFRRRVADDQRTGQINAATARAAYAVQDRRLKGARASAQQAVRPQSNDDLVGGGGSGSGSSGMNGGSGASGSGANGAGSNGAGSGAASSAGSTGASSTGQGGGAGGTGGGT